LNIRKIHAPAIVLVVSFGLASLTLYHVPSIAQSKDSEREDQTHKAKLYETDVLYENFVCSDEDSEIVATFFKEHPLNSVFPICHNDCPTIKCRPVIPFPPMARAARVTGIVSVHVLVDEKGKVLYARVLSGHPLLWAAAQKGACETQFMEYPYGKHQGMMHFTVNDYEFLGVPNTANQVR
jgi:hypothetical protein